jgi:hypothetical protein
MGEAERQATTRELRATISMQRKESGAAPPGTVDRERMQVEPSRTSEIGAERGRETASGPPAERRDDESQGSDGAIAGEDDAIAGEDDETAGKRAGAGVGELEVRTDMPESVSKFPEILQ